MILIEIYLYVFDLPIYMSKTRISIKLNDYEYSLLYRIQSSCTMTGLLYNRTPQLNEIIKGLISFVALNISQTHENLDTFFRTIKTDSEYPEDTLDLAVNIPQNAGNYIFIADEKDMELLHKIGEITENMYHEQYDMPKLIRYCLHYTLYGNIKPFSPNLFNERKYKFILPVIIGNLYYLSPRTSIELLYDPLLNMSRIGKKEYEFIRQIPLDEEPYKNAIKLLVRPYSDWKNGHISDSNIMIDDIIYKVDSKPPNIQERSDSTALLIISFQSLFNVLKTKKEKEFNSRIFGFNYVTTFIGLFQIIYMWYVDSFNVIDSYMLMLLSPHVLPKNFATMKGNQKNGIVNSMSNLLPEKLHTFIRDFLPFLQELFNKFLDISKKIH